MSYCNDTNTTMLVEPCNGNNGNGWGGAWGEWILVFLIFAIFGYGGFGGGFGGYGANGVNPALTRGELCQDMNFQDVKNAVMQNGDNMAAGFRNIDNAICQLGYNNAQLANGIQMQIGNEFRGLDNAICTLGYNQAQLINGVQNQLSNCCCEIKGGIKDVNTQSIFNTNAIQQQIQNCCCENEKIALQNRYENAQANCTTLQAIDKLGDRIIDYLAADRTQALRDENQALRLAASQQTQNNYIISQLKPPVPVPAFTVPNPNCCFNGGCGGV